MITRSGRKKNCTPVSEVTTPLSSLKNKKTKLNNTNETKVLTKSPVVEESNERNNQNVQSPIFNIHVHMPTIPSDLNESCQVQPVIHLHFGDVVSRLTSGSTSQNADAVKSFKVESLSEFNNNCEEQNESHNEIVTVPSEENETSKRLSFNNLNGNDRDLGTEEPEIALTQNYSLKRNESSKKSVLYKSKPSVRKKTSVKQKKQVAKKKNGGFVSNVVSESESPLRRSTRVANNLKLFETIKAISVKQSDSGKDKTKKHIKIAKDKIESGHMLNPFTLKKPMVVLCDKCRVHENDNKENITGCNSTNSMSIDNEDNTSLAEENACEINYSGSVNESCSSSIETEIYPKMCSSDGESLSDEEENDVQNESCTDVDDTDNLNISNYESSPNNEDTEEDRKKTLLDESSSDEKGDKTDVKKTSSDESLLSLGKKSGEIYSAIYTSDNEESCAENNASDVECNRINYMSTASSVENFASDYCGQGKENIQPNEYTIITEVDKTPSNVSLNNTDQTLNVESGTGGDVANYSNGSSFSGNLDTDLDEVDSNQSHKDAEEDGEQMPPVEEWDSDNSRLESENNNSLNNVEDECLSKSDDCEEISITSPSFILELIKKEMKTRKMTRQERNSKSAQKKKKSQVTKRTQDNSPTEKKSKLTNEGEISVKKTTEQNFKESGGNFIPLQVSGPTKFAVAQLNCIKRHEHKAKNFKAEMLFGKRVARFSDGNHLQTYRLKKKAATKRKKITK